MIPIYEQGGGRGIGHGSDGFLRRFRQILQEHVDAERAKAFAFLFYDFNDHIFKKVLKDQGVFVELDRLSGNNLSLFYLHAGGRKVVNDFNKTFLSKLGIDKQVNLPCVVFFKFNKGKIENVFAVQLENTNLIHGFKELYDVIQRYIDGSIDEDGFVAHHLKILRGSLKSIAKGSVESYFADLLKLPFVF